jgi:Cdc6-like AAA superfamily ATPase
MVSYAIPIDAYANQATIITFHSTDVPVGQLEGNDGIPIPSDKDFVTIDRHYQMDNLVAPIPSGRYTIIVGSDPNTSVYALVDSSLNAAFTGMQTAYTGQDLIIKAHFVNAQGGVAISSDTKFIAIVTEIVNGQPVTVTVILTQLAPNSDIFEGGYFVPSSTIPPTDQPQLIGNLRLDLTATEGNVTRSAATTVPLYVPQMPPCNQLLICIVNTYQSQIAAASSFLVFALLILLLPWLLWQRQPEPYGYLISNADVGRSVALNKRHFSKRLLRRHTISSDEIRKHPDAMGGFSFGVARFVITRKYKDAQYKGKVHLGVSKDNVVPIGIRTKALGNAKSLALGELYPLNPGDVITIDGTDKAIYSLDSNDSPNYKALRIATSDVPNTGQEWLYLLASSAWVEQRVRAAGELVKAIATGFCSLSEVQSLLSSLAYDESDVVRLALLQAILEKIAELPSDLTDLIDKYAQDRNDRLRATVASWIITEYNGVAYTYEHVLLNQLVSDRSKHVLQTIVDAIQSHSASLPTYIRELGQRLVELTQVEIELIKGGGMLEGEESELILQAKNCTATVVSRLTVELQESAEYFISSPNPCTLTDIQPGQMQTVSFKLKMGTHGRIAVNYRINGKMRYPPLYIQTIQDNPYVYGTPVHKVGFFGRQEELEEILRAISKPLKEDILLIGERRTGKTSALNRIKIQLERPFYPVYIVVNTVEPQTEEILKLIRTEIIQTLTDGKILDASWKDRRFDSEIFERNIAVIMQAARERVADIKLVLLLDEADYLLKVVHNIDRQIDDRIQNILRAMLQSEVGTDVRAVVAGTSDLSGYIAQRSSPFYNHFHEVSLKPLTHEETQKLITEPASALNYTYNSKIVDRICALSGGQPYLCQGLCYQAFSYALKNQQREIDEDALTAAEGKIIGELFRNYYLSGFWERMNTNERTFLANLIKRKSPVGATSQQVKHLLDWQLLVETQEKYDFQAELFRIWTRKALAERL